MGRDLIHCRKEYEKADMPNTLWITCPRIVSAFGAFSHTQISELFTLTFPWQKYWHGKYILGVQYLKKGLVVRESFWQFPSL